VLQQRETDHIEWLEDAGQMGMHTEHQNLVLHTVVFECLVEVALVGYPE
jgi:hypothetical protein